MAVITEYVNYVIYFTDQSLYNFAVSLSGTNAVQVNPAQAAAFFNFVEGINYNTGGPLNAVMGMYITTPMQGVQFGSAPIASFIQYPNSTGQQLAFNADSVTVTWNGAGTPPVNNQLKLVWNGNIVFQAADLKSTPALPIAPIPLRRWIVGFEFNEGAEGGGPSSINYSRDSSRTLDGVGWALRAQTNATYTHQLNDYITPADAHQSWERFYVRVRRFDAVALDIWKTVGTPSPNNGIRLKLKQDGSIDIFNVDSGAVEHLLGNSGVVLTLNFFAKIDCIVQYNDGVLLQGTFQLLVNGAVVGSFAVAPGSGGIGSVGTHASTTFGTQTAGANNWEVDLDDWHNAEFPKLTGVPTFNSPDFLAGTHISRQWVNSGTITNWVGQVQSMNQMMNPPNVAVTSQLTSTTALAQMEGVTDVDDQQSPVGSVFCACAALINTYGSKASGATPGALGYRLAGGAIVTTPTVESTVARFNTMMWPGTGVDVIVPSIVPFSVIYQKSNDAVSQIIKGLQCEVEYAGLWGFEDGSQTDYPRLYITHNAWFPQIAQAFLGPVPGPALTAAVGGTYTGNGTVQTIQLPLPPCFLWIRTVAGTSNGVKWFGAGLTGHSGGLGATRPDEVPRVDFDVNTGITTFTVVGTAAECNQNGVTYQYIAFCDPNFAFNLCGAWCHNSSVASAINPFIDPGFNAIAAFFAFDFPSNDGTVRLIYKGPGHTGTNGTIINGTNAANVGTFAAGQFTSGVDAQNAGGDQLNYSFFKSTDGCGFAMFQITSYTGNGGGSQVINLPLTTGRFPLLVYVQPHNAVGFVKDPSDVTTNSRQVTGNTASATAITAVAADQITVGTTLNANGIIYEVFVLLGDSAGFNNGTFYAAPCLPKNLVTTSPPVGLNILSDGGLIIGGANALTLLKDVSGIYTLVDGKTNDTVYDRQPAQTSKDLAIPNPYAEGGYIGG